MSVFVSSALIGSIKGGKMFSKKRKGLGIILIMGLMIIVGRGYADLSVSAVANYTERQCVIEGDYPKVGEIFTVKYRVRLKEGVPLTANYYVSMLARRHDPVEIIDDQEVKIQGLSNDAWKEVRLRAKITEPALTISLAVNIRLEGTRDRMALSGVGLVLIDPLTGQYGKKEEHYEQLFKGAEWHYDPAGEFVGAPDRVSPDCAKKNLEIIARIQKINPELTDWEAIYLHYDGIQAVMGGIGTTGTTEEEIWRFLLESGWLDKQRADKDIKEQWLKKLINKYKGKPLVMEGGPGTKFFRNTDNTNTGIGDNSDSTQNRWSYIAKNVRLWWNKNTESDLQGYRIYRQTIPEFGPVSGWSNIAENDDPEDTTYLDESTMYSTTYEYKVTAYDSLGTESEYSDSVRVTTQGRD